MCTNPEEYYRNLGLLHNYETLNENAEVHKFSIFHTKYTEEKKVQPKF